MDTITREWAGKPRAFRLAFGQIMDLQAACGDVGFGAMWQAISVGAYRVEYVYHTIKQGLIGGGASALEARQIMDKHFDHRPMIDNTALASEIILAVMTGIEPTDDEAGDDSDATAPMKFSDMGQICFALNMSPEELRQCRYADLLNMMRGYKAARKDDTPEPPTEAEFLAILDKYEPKD